MKKVVINPKKLVKDNSWLELFKVRAVIEDKDGNFLLSKEAGKYIFPGGKCENGESIQEAIIREIKEETGIELLDEELIRVLEIEAFYDDFYDYRTDSYKPRYMLTTYFKAKTDKNINLEKLCLTESEKKDNFNIFSYCKEELYNLLLENHSKELNGKFFDEENKIVIDEILSTKNH